jgi:hypothetical protein
MWCLYLHTYGTLLQIDEEGCPPKKVSLYTCLGYVPYQTGSGGWELRAELRFLDVPTVSEWARLNEARDYCRGGRDCWNFLV